MSAPTPHGAAPAAPDPHAAARRRWLNRQLWAGILIPAAIYIYGNLAAARWSPTLIVAGIALPICYCLAVHVAAEARLQSRTRAARAALLVGTGATIVPAGAWSWVHIVEAATRVGTPPLVAIAFPLCIDALMVCALLALHAERRDRWDGEQTAAQRVADEQAAADEGRRLAIPAATLLELSDELGLEVQQEAEPTTFYQLEDVTREVIYVGITNDLARRLRQHAQTQDWWPEVAVVSSRTYPTRALALAVEEHTIEAQWPRYNRRAGTVHGALPPVRRVINVAPLVRTRDDLERLSRDDLREIARSLELPVRGSRDDLAARVRPLLPPGADGADDDGEVPHRADGAG